MILIDPGGYLLGVRHRQLQSEFNCLVIEAVQVLAVGLLPKLPFAQLMSRKKRLET